MKLTKEERFDRIAIIIQAADKEAGDGARYRDMFDLIPSDDLMRIYYLSTRPADYDFNGPDDLRFGASV